MTHQARSRRRVTQIVVALSVIAWGLLLIDHISRRDGISNSICSAARDWLTVVSYDVHLALNALPSIAFGWMLMLATMMLPTLTAPIFHIYERSFAHRRLRSVSIFVLGYCTVWMLIGILLLAIQVVVSALLPGSNWPALLMGVVALVWQCSPLKQLCLNRNHNHAELAAFGRAADLSAFKFGITHGFWCVGSCWALMLFPLLLVEGHLVAMLAVTVVMIGERLENPGPLIWRVRGLENLVRIAVHTFRPRRFSFGGQFRWARS